MKEKRAIYTTKIGDIIFIVYEDYTFITQLYRYKTRTIRVNNKLLLKDIQDFMQEKWNNIKIEIKLFPNEDEVDIEQYFSVYEFKTRFFSDMYPELKKIKNLLIKIKEVK